MSVGVSQILKEEHGIEGGPGKKVECPVCGHKTFSVKADDSVGKCFHPSCGKTITAKGWGGGGRYPRKGVFERLSGNSIEELARTCAPALQELIREKEPQLVIPFDQKDEEVTDASKFIEPAVLQAIPSRYQKAIEHAVRLFHFFQNKEGMPYASAFTPLLGSLDEASKGLILKRLLPHLPAAVPEQKDWFDPYMNVADHRTVQYYQGMAKNLKKTLVFRNGLSPVGLLRSCLDFALKDKTELGGVFKAIKTTFNVKGAADLLGKVEAVNDFRNTYIAHQDKELANAGLAEKELKRWIAALQMLAQTK